MPVDSLKFSFKPTKNQPPPPQPDNCPKCMTLRHVVNIGGKAKLYCSWCGYTSKANRLHDNDSSRLTKGKQDR
ncbi:MAG: hypothetical protein WC365_07630 [Candidatus Babeliales bacterium]